MRMGVCILTDLPWATAEPMWRELDDLPVAHGWTYDHLVWGTLPDDPWYSTTVTLAAAAAVTSRIKLGAWVFSPNYRHPVTLARELAGLQDLSGGRMLCAVGSGGEPDATVLGADLSRGARTRRFAEFVDLLGRAVTEDHLDHDGEFFAARDARNVTGTPAPPVIVAGNGPRSIALAARVGAWATTGGAVGAGNADPGSVDEAVDQWWAELARLSALLDDAGGQGIDRYLNLDSCPRYSLSSKEFCLDQVGRAAELGFTDVIVSRPRPTPPYQGDVATLHEVLAAANRDG